MFHNGGISISVVTQMSLYYNDGEQSELTLLVYVKEHEMVGMSL